MFPELSFSSTAILWSLAGATLVLLSIIYGVRWFISRKALDIQNNQKPLEREPGVLSRTKYAAVDVDRWRSTILYFSLAFVMAVAVLAFNWTVAPPEEVKQDFSLSLEADIEVTPPQTAAPPPPPPPPPPPVVNVVPTEIDLDEDVEFEDMYIDEETVLDVPEPYVAEQAAPPPPPPPPPPKEPEIEEIFRVVEDMPRFPGCEGLSNKTERENCANQKLLEYVYSEIRYPDIAKENAVEGTVVLQFVVGKDGQIRDSRIVRDVGGGCGKEALRVVDLMNSEVGQWVPGRQRGVPVPVMFTLPIKFKLDSRP